MRRRRLREVTKNHKHSPSVTAHTKTSAIDKLKEDTGAQHQAAQDSTKDQLLCPTTVIQESPLPGNLS